MNGDGEPAPTGAGPTPDPDRDGPAPDPDRAGAAGSATGTGEPRQRLHPLSPLLHGAKMLAVLIAAISIQGAAQLGWLGFLGTLLVGACVAVAYSAVTWLVTGYHVVGRELRIHDGVFVRRTRAIPLERLQAVDVVRPVLARLTGLAELRLEVVGRGKTEAPLAYLTVSDATALRERLLALAVRVGAPAAPAVPPETTGGEPEPAPAQPERPAPTAETRPGLAGLAQRRLAADAAGIELPDQSTERPLHAVVNRDVVVGQLLTPQVIFLPVAVTLVVLQYVVGADAWSLVVVASMAAAIIGVIQQPVRRVFSDWDFRISLSAPPTGRHQPPGLRIRHGLTETRVHTVPLNRVQAVGVTWPFLWRRRRWLRARLDVAGYGPADQNDAGSDRLLPVGNLATARELIGVALADVDPTAITLTPPPERARWLAPVQQPVLGTALTDRVFASRSGRVTRQLVLVPLQRVQSVRLRQGPLQRLLGLAHVYADTAGSLTAVAHHRPLAEARALAADLSGRARRARTEPPAPAPPPAPPDSASPRDPTAPADPAGSGESADPAAAPPGTGPEPGSGHSPAT